MKKQPTFSGRLIKSICLTKNLCFVHAWTLLPWRDSNPRPISIPYRSDHLSYTTSHFIYIAYYHRPSYARQPHPASAFAGIIPAQQYGLTHYWCLLSGYVNRSLNTPLLPWIIRPTSLMSHSSLGLTLLPIPVPVAPRPTRERLDSEITLSPPAVLTDWVPSLSTPSVCWSVSMPFRGGHSRYGYPGDTIHHVTLFLPTYRDCTLHVPWRLWKVKDSNLRCARLHRNCGYRCFRPLSQPSFVYCPAILSRLFATVPVALAAVVFFSVLMIPFSLPSAISLFVLCTG